MTNKWIVLNNELKILNEKGQYQFDKDKEAVREYMIEFVNKNTVFFHSLKEKLNYLFENDYYDKSLFDMYTFKEIKMVFDKAYKKKFRFESFTSAYKFYKNYALMTDDNTKFLERYEDRVSINALEFGQGDLDKAMAHVESLINQEYQPATPTFLNTGRSRAGEKVSCFLIDTPDDTEGIMYMQSSVAQLSRMGGGIGINLSRLRASNDPIKKIHGAASSVIGIAKLVENTVNHFNQLGLTLNGSTKIWTIARTSI